MLVCIITAALKNYEFKQSCSDYSLVTLQHGAVQLNVLAYVDELVISGSHLNDVQKFKDYLSACFHTKYLGILKYFLGVEVAPGPDGFVLCQHK